MDIRVKLVNPRKDGSRFTCDFVLLGCQSEYSDLGGDLPDDVSVEITRVFALRGGDFSRVKDFWVGKSEEELAVLEA